MDGKALLSFVANDELELLKLIGDDLDAPRPRPIRPGDEPAIELKLPSGRLSVLVEDRTRVVNHMHTSRARADFAWLNAAVESARAIPTYVGPTRTDVRCRRGQASEPRVGANTMAPLFRGRSPCAGPGKAGAVGQQQ